jgi:hypothetical protein
MELKENEPLFVEYTVRKKIDLAPEDSISNVSSRAVTKKKDVKVTSPSIVSNRSVTSKHGVHLTKTCKHCKVYTSRRFNVRRHEAKC